METIFRSIDNVFGTMSFRPKRCVKKVLKRCLCHWCFAFIPGQCKTQEMCKKVVLERPFMPHLVLDQYKTQGICEKAAKL